MYTFLFHGTVSNYVKIKNLCVTIPITMTSAQNTEGVQRRDMRTVGINNQTRNTTSPASRRALATSCRNLRSESKKSRSEDSEEDSDISDTDLSTSKQKSGHGHYDCSDTQASYVAERNVSGSDNDNITRNSDTRKRNYGHNVTSHKPNLNYSGEATNGTHGNVSGASKSSKFIIILLLVIVFALLIAYFLSTNKDVHGTNGGVPTERLRDKIRRLKIKFPKQETDTWYALIGGIIKVVEDNPNEPSIFLLLHNHNDYTSGCLARKVSEVAMEFFNSSSNGSPVELQGKDLKKYEELNADYGWLIDKYSPILKEQHVMIVYDLQKIPAHLAQTFHAFCDPHSPLVDRAVILFTLETTDALLEGNPTKLAESTLTKLWGENLEKEIFHPLLVRITNDVHFVKPENLMSC